MALDLFSERAAWNHRDGAFLAPHPELERRQRQAVRLAWICTKSVRMRELCIRHGTRGPPDSALETDGRVPHRGMPRRPILRKAFFALSRTALESRSSQD